MPVKSLTNMVVTYNATNITPYLNKASLEMVADAVDTSNLASTAKENLPALPSLSMPIGGFWSNTLDAVLGADAFGSPMTLRALTVQIGPSGNQISYERTATDNFGAFISDYKIETDNPLGMLTWSATLNISGPLERVTVGLDALMTKLVAYWPLDEAGGAVNALDAHTNALHLAQAGSPGNATGKVYPTARTIADVDESFVRASESLLQTGDVNWGLAVWVYPTISNRSHTLVAKANTGNYGEFAFATETGLGSMWLQCTTTTGTKDLAIAVSVPLNAWTLLILQHDAAAKKFIVYKNNAAGVETAAYTGTILPTADAFTVGDWSGGNGSFGLRGRIGPLLFWKNLKIDAQARSALWNGGNGLSYAETPGIFTTLLTVGDSITEGYSATAEEYRWANIVAATKGWQLINTGISGSCLQNTVQNTVAVIGGPTADNLRDTYQARIIDHAPNWVVILYGTNDARLNDAAMTAAKFQNDFGEIIDALLAAGIAADRIVICSLPWMEPAYYNYGPHAPYNGATAQKYADHRAAAAAVAAAKGTRYADVYQAMADVGTPALMSADHVHPINAGHAIIASTVLAALA